jgi:hypothetical protein
MDVVKSLKLGKNGTKRVVERYGDDLVAVRYRHDPERQISYTTAELIVERKSKPAKTRAHTPEQSTAWVFVRISFGAKRGQAIDEDSRGAGKENKFAPLFPNKITAIIIIFGLRHEGYCYWHA